MKEMLLGEGAGPTIQFLHANAYTPGCYREMFRHFQKYNYNIILPYQRPLWPDATPEKFTNWEILADDIIQEMEEKGRKDVIGVGHSMGGIASWLAAVKRPDLFLQLILIDPVVLPIGYFRTMAFLPHWMKKKFIPIIKIAANRTDFWESKDEAREYLLSKKVFQRFDSEVLEDFLEYGMKKVQGGLTLAFPRAWESRVYGSPPNMWHKMSQKICPITIIRAEYSDVINEERWTKMQESVANGKFIQLDNTRHLVPFEQPELMANTILDILHPH